uniref:Endoplasmic reticulum lectin 1 n=1 Tax=Schistocephalus solidus TaxID=70667 RepID=A0A0X3P0S6_SCHSO
MNISRALCQRQLKKKNYQASIDSEKNGSMLLREMFNAAPCTYKVHGYWSYELCHDKHIRQYRAEVISAESTQIVKEFYLGYKLAREADADTNSLEPAVPKSIHLNGRDLPYYESKFDNGTKCDLTGQPRKASVLYVCVENSVGDLFQIMETETCVYQLIVFTNSLCKSQKYSHRKPYSNVISCQAHDEKSPKQPRALEAFLKDKVSLSEDGEATLEGIFGNVHVKGLQVEKVQQGGSVVYRVRTRDTLDKSAKSAEEEYEEQEADITTSQEDRQLPPKVEAEQDPASEPPNFDLEGARTREIHSFLRGSTCLTGGLGWWKHEVCYGSKIVHYHEDPNTKERTEIVLGTWSKDVHMKWIRRHVNYRPHSDPKKRTKVSQYYGGGDLCEDIKTRRSVVLTLQCQPAATSTVQLSFSEPNACHYSITLESSLFCDIVKQSDENGILPLPA